jgi:chemotaxis protein MotB
MAEEGFEPPDESWLATYADAITLLMAFFVMLLTFAEYDIPAYQEAVAGIQESIGGNSEAATPITELQVEIQDVMIEMDANQVAEVHKDDKGVVIDLASGAFFNSGTADVRDAAIPVLERIVQVINAPNWDYYKIEAEGHTDDDPISTERFPSNWELSAGRASAIVRVFAVSGIVSIRMKAAGYADTRPKVPNRNPDGTPIPENQAVNRRITIHVIPMSMDEQAEYENRRAQIAQFQEQMEEAAQPTDVVEPTSADPGAVSILDGQETQ